MPANGQPAPQWRIQLLIALIAIVAGFGAGVEYGSRTSQSPLEQSELIERAVQQTAARDVEHNDQIPNDEIAADAGSGAAAEEESTGVVEAGAVPVPSTTPPSHPTMVGNDDDHRRCTAVTQAGTRCKRKAQEDRERCWQH